MKKHRRSYNVLHCIYLYVLVLLTPTTGLSIILHADGEPNLLTWTDKPASAIVGRWPYNASFVVVSPKWIVTTRHQNSNPAIVNIDGINYKCVYNSQWTGGPTGLVDIRLIRLENANGSDPNLAYAPPYTDTDEVTKNIRIGGYGKYRGITLYSDTKDYGYSWAGTSNNTLRWGENIIDGTVTSQYVSPYDSNTLFADFDKTGTVYEAAPATWDSGGGWFINQNGTWKLAALSAYVERLATWYDDPNTGPTDPDHFWGIRISSYAAWINEIITNDCPAGDIDGDCKVDMLDVAQLTDRWLHTGCTSENNFCQWADIQPDGKVNMFDLSILAENWLVDKSL